MDPSKKPGDKLGLAGNNCSPWTIGVLLTNILYAFEKSSRGVHPRVDMTIHTNYVILVH